MFDLLLHGGTVIDGTGQPRVAADVAIAGERIAAVGKVAGQPARRSLDCTGRVVAPGFIDVHNHSDGWMLVNPHQTYKTSQGFTTEVLMADGISYAPVSEQNWREWLYYLRSLNGLPLSAYRGWRSLADYMALLDRRNVQNAATHVPYANVRALACGFTWRPVDDHQMRLIQSEIRRGMEAGAVGLSTGLDYVAQNCSTTDELVRACEAIRPYDGLYVTHVRYKLGLLPALKEAVEIGRRAGVKVHISHLKGTTEQEMQEVLAYLDQARREVDLSYDVYPYLRGSTMLNFLFPYEIWEDGPLSVLSKLSRADVRARFKPCLETKHYPLEGITIAWSAAPGGQQLAGKSIGDLVREWDKPVEEVLIDLLIESNLATLLVLGPREDEVIEPLLAHDLGMLGSDGIYFPGGHVHPRVFGSVGRWLGRAVREHRVTSLETAVHKMSGKPAARFGLAGRGLVRAEAFADLVVFDPAAIIDRADYDRPRETCLGIDHVIVNGVLVVENAAPQANLPSPLPGRFVRYER